MIALIVPRRGWESPCSKRARTLTAIPAWAARFACESPAKTRAAVQILPSSSIVLAVVRCSVRC